MTSITPEQLAEAMRILNAAATSGSRPTVAEVWERYAKDPGVSARTWESYRTYWSEHVGPHFGARIAEALTLDDVAEYRAKRKTETCKFTKKPPRPATINREVSLLKTALAWATDRGIISRNPIARARKEPERNRRSNAISARDLERALAVCDPRLKAFVLILADSGLRRAEACGLRCEDILWDRNQVYVSPRYAKLGKGRIAPLTSRTKAALIEYGFKAGDTGWLFPTKRAAKVGHVQPDGFLVMWREICRTLKLRGPDGEYTLHDLRASAATTWDEAGVSMAKIGRMLGHAGLDTTERYVRPRDTEDALPLIEARISRRPEREKDR